MNGVIPEPKQLIGVGNGKRRMDDQLLLWIVAIGLIGVQWLITLLNKKCDLMNKRMDIQSNTIDELIKLGQTHQDAIKKIGFLNERLDIHFMKIKKLEENEE